MTTMTLPLTRPRASETTTLLVPPVVLLILYSLLPNLYKMYDVIQYAIAIERDPFGSPGLWHPSHLLYGPIGYLGYHGLRLLGFNPSVFQIYTGLGILSASLIVFLLGRLLFAHGVPAARAAVSLVMWIGSYAAWH